MDKPAFTHHNAPITDARLLPVRAPAQPFGRNRELASGHIALKANTSILLNGPAGIGKSTLAAVLAAGNIAKNPGGVLWFTMFEDDAEQLLTRVARAYGLIALPNTLDKRREAVRGLLDKRRPLIVLDGLTDVESVRDFARNVAAGIPMILMHNEPVAGPWTPIPLKPLTPADSLLMLKALSGLKDEADQGDLEGLVRVLGGDPLALNLAGRHLSATQSSPAELIGALSIGAPGGKVDSQQQVLSVVFKKLSPPVQGIFLVLAAAFAGGASAELLTDMSGLPASQLLIVLRQIEAHGLADEWINYGQVRFSMHESIQAFARRWLQANGRLDAAENRTLQSVLKYVHHHSREGTQHHDRLAAEIDNIMGAAAFATSIGQANTLKDLSYAFGTDASEFVMLRGFQTELGQLRKLQTLLEYEGHSDEPIAEGAPATRLLASFPADDPLIIKRDVPSLLLDPVEPLPPIPPRPAPETAAPIKTEPVRTESGIPSWMLPPSATPAPPTPPVTNWFDAQPDQPTTLEMPDPAPESTFNWEPESSPPPSEPTRSLFGDLLTAPPPPLPVMPAAPEPIKPLLFTRPTDPALAPPTPPDSAPEPVVPSWFDRPTERLSPVIATTPPPPFSAPPTTPPATPPMPIFAPTPAPLPTMPPDVPAETVESLRAMALPELMDRLDKVTDSAALARLHSVIADKLNGEGRTAEAQSHQGNALAYAFDSDDDALRGELCFKVAQPMIDNQLTLNQGVSLLAEAARLLPGNSDAERLLKRARQRLDRLQSGGTVIPAAIDNREFAEGLLV